MRSGLQLGKPAFVQSVGGGRDGQAGQQFPLVVVDAGGHAAHPELELFVVGEDRERSKTPSTRLCPQLARVGEYAVVGEVERGEDAAS